MRACRRKCHGCGAVLGCASSDRGSQTIIFGCIDFWSAYCPAPETTAGMASYDTALAKFATCTMADQGVGQGYRAAMTLAQQANSLNSGFNDGFAYCHGSLQDAAKLSNQGVCLTNQATGQMPSNVDIAFHIRIPFKTNQGGAYTFRIHADYGLGSYVGVDGAEHTPGNTWGHLQLDPIQLTAGDHEFESLGFEDCCDGHAELEVHLPCDRSTSTWRLVRAGLSDCMTCNTGQLIAASCASQTTSAGECGSTGSSGGARCPAFAVTCTAANTFTPRCNMNGGATTNCCCDPPSVGSGC